MASLNFYDFLDNISYITPERKDIIRYELDSRFHYYGDHFKFPCETYSIKNGSYIRDFVKYLFTIYKIFRNSKSKTEGDIILSNAYFSVNDELRKLGYQVFCPSWQMSQDRNILSNLEVFYASEKIKFKFKKSNFNDLLKDEFLCEIDEFENKLMLFFQKNKMKSLFVPNDMSFFENLSIQICKKIGIPSFIFLHGLPGRYNQIDDNRSDYLIVWGEKIKEHYIKVGMNPNKIFISGHPFYKSQKQTYLKFSFDNILILTKPLNGVHMSDGVILGNRANLILYLYSVERVLSKIGIKTVRFRPHPSENENWYLKFINNDFYKIDRRNIQESIQDSSLIIGPTSTVFLESLYNGVNYVVYEPSFNNIDIINIPLVPPFDGNDPKIPVAKDEAELEFILNNRIIVNPTCFNDYISTPFNLSFIKNLI